jgi:hypothetical protein
MPAETMENIPTKTEFAQNLRTTFHVQHGEEEPLALRLIECKEGSAHNGHEQCTLLFHGPDHFVLPGRTYQLRHEHIGEFDLFLVAVSADQSGLYYEAVFTHNSRS